VLRSNLLGILYLVIGILVANDHHYVGGVNRIEEVVELVLAVALWPLVLLDVSMRI
jgi:hypothetical protein